MDVVKCVQWCHWPWMHVQSSTKTCDLSVAGTSHVKVPFTHARARAVKVCVTGRSGSTLSARWYKWFNVRVCVCMFMLLSANSSSAACPAPCKDQTPCLLEERQNPDWLCFLYSAIKKKKVTWPTHWSPSTIMTLTSSWPSNSNAITITSKKNNPKKKTPCEHQFR